MLNWMIRTWWVQLLFGCYFLYGLLQPVHPSISDTARWIGGGVQALVALLFFVGAATAWRNRRLDDRP